VRNIDDPFDGTLGGTPNDLAPADYKLVEYQLTCDTCARYKILTMATYVAPKNLESSSRKGNLFVRVLDADGLPVSGATVRVTNASVTPRIDLTDITNADGLLPLVDIATSSTGYHITVSKTGYNNDQTYPPGNPAHPVKPDATVASQQLTIASLFIDRVGSVSIRTRDQFCSVVPGFDFILSGSKLIATEPSVPKYSAALFTPSSGTFLNSQLEWDVYSIVPTDTALGIAGTTSSLSFTLDPSSSYATTWLVASRSQQSLLVSVTDQTGKPLDGAQVQLTKTGFSDTQVSGVRAIVQTDWSSGAYSDKSAYLNTSTAGTLTLSLSNGSYASAGQEWLISETYNLGTSSATFTSIQWTPAEQPATTGADALAFQVAGNNDNATWNWIGPDGTSSTFFTQQGQAIPSSLSGNQYFRYRVHMQTSDDTATPSLNDVSFGFASGCVPSGQAYFNALPVGSYTLSVTTTGYQPYSVPVTISNPWQRIVVPLSP
jgi:hypothetical protein